MKRFCLLLGFHSLVLVMLRGADSANINFTSPTFEIGKTSDGTLLPATFNFSLGSFGSFVPTGYNLPRWQPNFTALLTVPPETTPPTTSTSLVAWDTGLSQYSATAIVNTNSAPFAATNQAYVWGFNGTSPSLVNGSQWILLTNAAWKFPGIAAVPPVVSWDASDAGTSAIIGFRSSGTVNQTANPYLQTAAVSPNVVLPALTMTNFDAAAAGTTTQTGTLTISGVASFKSLNDSGGAITLDANANTFGSISAQVRNAADTADAVAAINLRSTGAMTLAGIRTGGSLTLVSIGGVITQTAAVIAGGATSITAGAAAITLNHADNDFVGALNLNNSGANNVAVSDANMLQLGVTSVGGTLTLTAPGGITVAGNVSAGALALNNATTLSAAAVTTTGNQTYTGAVTLGGNATLTSTGGGLISFLNALIGGNATLAVNTAGPVSFVSASNLVSLTKDGSGTMTLSGQSTYTGTTNLNAGTLSLGASNALFSTSPFRANGGTFALNGHTQTLGLLTITANSVFNFGGSGGTLTFADSSAQAWSGTLTITNYSTATNSLRFGSSSTGLTPTQLSLLRFTDYGNAAGQIDSSGLITPSAIPEPATWAGIAGVVALGAAVVRRKMKSKLTYSVFRWLR